VPVQRKERPGDDAHVHDGAHEQAKAYHRLQKRFWQNADHHVASATTPTNSATIPTMVTTTGNSPAGIQTPP
jgi:hypothetical protein